MDYPQILIDVLRATHLVFFAAGMGTGIYFDFQKFSTLNAPLSAQDIQNLERLHIWISTAFGGLWITGLILIYVRTSFIISDFSPKLWLKIGLMTLMLWNSRLISSVVIRALKANIGRSLISLPLGQLIAVTQIGILSMFGWTSGLLLGSSVVLKTAPWGVLLPLALGWCALLTLCGQAVLLLRRRKLSVVPSAAKKQIPT